MKINVIDGEFSICKLKTLESLDLSGQFCFVGKTDEEISLVCPTVSVPDSTDEREDGWRAFRIEGVLDFSQVGILCKISTKLSEANIGIFAVSTYNTDYILVKTYDFPSALKALESAGYNILIK